MKAKKKEKSFIEHLVEIVVLVAVALIFRSVLYEPYVVPSSSMLPSLLIGDRIVVNKYSYGISRYSFPFSPNLFKGRIFAYSKPQQGDIVVFEKDKIYVKRLIGTPGDRIQMIDGVLYINDHRIPKVVSGLFKYNDNIDIPEYLETLPNGVQHNSLDLSRNSRFDTTEEFTVPKGHYFFMGDNRDNSRDSRDGNGPIGFVPEENLLGKVSTVLFSSPEISWWNIPNILLNLKSDRFAYSLVK
jgi:signal peptidase I